MSWKLRTGPAAPDVEWEVGMAVAIDWDGDPNPSPRPVLWVSEVRVGFLQLTWKGHPDFNGIMIDAEIDSVVPDETDPYTASTLTCQELREKIDQMAREQAHERYAARLELDAARFAVSRVASLGGFIEQGPSVSSEEMKAAREAQAAKAYHHGWLPELGEIVLVRMPADPMKPEIVIRRPAVVFEVLDADHRARCELAGCQQDPSPWLNVVLQAYSVGLRPGEGVAEFIPGRQPVVLQPPSRSPIGTRG